MIRVFLILIFLALSFSLISCSRSDGNKKANNQNELKQPKVIYNYDVAYLTGRFEPAKNPDFVSVEKKYTDKDTYLRKDAYAAYENMYQAAAQNGINLKIISATRNYYEQKGIWESAWREDTSPDSLQKAKNILIYHSMPSTSRHHWGTDVDLIALDNEYFDTPVGKKEYTWLFQNAHKYGFYQPYTKKGDNRKTGYNEEKWHWSYLPLSKEVLRQYTQKVSYADITGFYGSEMAKDIGMIENYVLGVEEDCK